MAGSVLPDAGEAASGRRPLVLGILNVTPDSFSDGGEHETFESAIAFAEQLALDGAEIIDVGGESTRPGAVSVPTEEEQRRVLPVVRELVRRGLTVSIDTMHATTADRAVEAGAAIVNDVSGGADPDMAAVVAAHDVRYVVMHSRVPGVGGTERATYTDTVGEVASELSARISTLVDRGVDRSRIIVDPGLGFSKTAAHNWELLAGLDRLRGLGHPVLVGASRKRFLGSLVETRHGRADGSVPGVTPAPATRPAHAATDAATAVTSVLAADAGAWGVRVHDVAATTLALDVWCAWTGAAR